MNFKLLQELVDELNSSNSTLDKIAVLSKEEYNDQFIKDVFVATYNPFVKYNVTPANLKKNPELCSPNNYDLFELLDKLGNREITGHDAISAVNGFIQNHLGYEELIHNIFDRNLKTRTTSSIINKVHKKLIPTFDVTLAKKYEEHMKKVNFDKDVWFASRKLDGLRCVAIIDYDGSIEMKSRTGIPFNTLQLVIDELQKLDLKGVVFDGEICIVDDEGNEDFTAILKLYNKKDFTIPNPRYKMFDMIPLEDFNAKKGNQSLGSRISFLKAAVPEDNNFLSFVEQTIVRDEEHLQELRDKAKELGWEGMMIRKDEGYEGKRSDKLLKCKLFIDAEYYVKSVVFGDMRIIAEDINGKTKEITEPMLSKVVIEHKGYEVGVGSGFSMEERGYYYEHPEEIIGKQITVQYFEETTNEKGGISLRFPTVKAIYKDGDREV
jgi:DNA ligase-1